MALGRTLGRLFYLCARSRVRVIEKNLATCFPELSPNERAQRVKQNCLETGMMFSQTLMAFLGPDRGMFSESTIEGREHLDAAIEQGQGVLLVSGHFTALDMGGRAICQHFPVAGVYRPHKNPVMEYVVKKSRLRYAAEMFTRDALKGIVKHLKSGGIVWYAPDQDYRRGQSVFVDFFATPASTITATHQLARMTGCQVMTYEVVRKEGKPRYEFRLHPPIQAFPSKDATSDTQRINHSIETMVKAAPTQYLWMHKRFKTRPEGEGRFY